jgi:hypothetical protein
MAAGANILKKVRPQAPSMADYMTKGTPDYMSTRPATMPPMLSYTPRMMEGEKPQWAQGGQAAYQTANTDYEDAMATMRQDAAEHVQDWSTDFPKGATAGQALKAPALLSPVDQLVGKAPVGDLYGGHDVSSIVNLRKKKRAA